MSRQYFLYFQFAVPKESFDLTDPMRERNEPEGPGASVNR